jgi:uncharacterized membrane protein
VQGGWIKAVRERIRAYFVAGILAFAPLGITIWAISWIIQRLDNMLLPRVLTWIGLEDPPRLPFVGALFTFVVATATCSRSATPSRTSARRA